jgi:hypothetical protein
MTWGWQLYSPSKGRSAVDFYCPWLGCMGVCPRLLCCPGSTPHPRSCTVPKNKVQKPQEKAIGSPKTVDPNLLTWMQTYLTFFSFAAALDTWRVTESHENVPLLIQTAWVLSIGRVMYGLMSSSNRMLYQKQKLHYLTASNTNDEITFSLLSTWHSSLYQQIITCVTILIQLMVLLDNQVIIM